MRIHKYCQLNQSLKLTFSDDGKFKLVDNGANVAAFNSRGMLDLNNYMFHIECVGQHIKANNNALYKYAITCDNEDDLQNFLTSFKIKSIKINNCVNSDKGIYYAIRNKGGHMFLKESSTKAGLAAYMLVGAVKNDEYQAKVSFVANTNKIHNHLLVFKGTWKHEGFIDSGFNRKSHLTESTDSNKYQAYGDYKLADLVEQVNNDYDDVSEMVYNGREICSKQLAVLLLVHSKE